MSTHKPVRRATRRRLPSVRVRALLALGVALGIGATGTLAAWTDDVTISGSSFTAGKLDLKVNDADAYATTSLTMTSMVPGNTSAEVLTVKNGGSAPLKYSLAGGLTAADDSALFSSSAALKLTVVLNGTKQGTGNTSTCSTGAGTTTLVNGVALTTTTTAALIAKRGPAAGFATNAGESLCFQVTFDANAPTGLQEKKATATFTATGTSDLS